MLRCVILDMDGTLLDTETLSVAAWQGAGKKFGYDIPRDFIIHYFGMTIDRIAACYREQYGEDFPFEQVQAQRNEIGRIYFLDHPMPVKPGAKELLTCLRERGVTAVVATSTHYDTAVANLKKAGLYELLDGVVGGNMCARGKPAPDIFLKALELAGAAKEESIIVEDSRPGVRAGVAAGCRVIMVPDLTAPDEELRSLAYCCCPSLLDVRDLVAQGQLD